MRDADQITERMLWDRILVETVEPLQARIAELEAERDALKKSLRLTVAAMKRGVDVGCVEDLDACDDGGEFWHAALRQGVAALGRSGEANRG